MVMTARDQLGDSGMRLINQARAMSRHQRGLRLARSY
jgi:hypothetical protein